MLRKLGEGDVFATKEEKKSVIGPRTAVLPDGGLICTYGSESFTGINDFVPMMCFSEDGEHWSEPAAIWPSFAGKKSMNVSVRPTEDGKICVCGIGFDIDEPGERWWIDEEAAMKDNWLVYSISEDGRSFPEPVWVKPAQGACENPGGMLVEKDGRISIVYSPYPIAGRPGEADLGCMMLMESPDGGKTFVSRKTARTAEPSEYAEAWITKLGNGIRVIAMWQTATQEDPDQYVFSCDGGKTYSGIKKFPFRGQSMAITPWGEDRMLVIYNQRKEDPKGVWVAGGTFDENGFHMEWNEPVWAAACTTRSDSSGEFSQWTDFSFGEPQLTVLPDGTFLAVLWYEQDGVKGARYVHLAAE